MNYLEEGLLASREEPARQHISRRKRIAIGVLVSAVVYFSSTTLAYRNSLVELFWETYLHWLPNYSIDRAIESRIQFSAVKDFILERSLTPSTAKFCRFSQTKFGTDTATGNKAMAGWVDMQNRFGAMIRMRFIAVFRKGNRWKVEVVRPDEGDEWH